jgi:hypothetical protein
VGLSQDGSKLALLKGSKLSSRGFAKSDDPQPLPVERSLDEASPPRAGFLSLSDSGEVPAVMISGKLTYWKDPREPVSIDAETFKRALGETDLFRFYDIVNGAVRTVTRQRGGPDQRKILIQEVRPGPNPQQLSVLDLIRDTRPAQQNFSPVLADGCGLLADLEQPPPTREGPLAIRLILNGLAMSRQQIDQRIRSDLILSMGFTLDCRFLVLRDRDGGSSGAQRLRIFPLSTDGKTIQAQEPQAVSVPSSDPPVPTQIPSLRPLLAVAHATNGEWRFAWEVHGGIRLETASVKPGAPTVPQRSETLLSGMSAGGSKLVFSEDGRFLTLVRQPFGSKAEVAVWDLDDINRQTAVPRSDLFARACSIVAQGHGGTRATVEEQLTWYGHVVSQQPCTPLQDNASRPNSTETSSR